MIPETMKFERRWVNWKFETRDGDKPTKVPYQPNGRHAKTNDPDTWSDYNQLAPGQFAGFVLGDGWWGVDLDDSAAWQDDIIKHFPEAYVEKSPSGKGVKLFCRGCDPVKGRKRQMPTGAIEVYGAGRYFAVTGEVIQQKEPGDCSAGLAWLLEAYFPVVQTVAMPATPRNGIEDRVAKYLAAVPGAVSGCGGHNHTFHVAGQLVHGFALSVEQALPAFQAWNLTCQPPWSDAELERKLSEAAKAPCDKPRGWLLNESTEWASAPVDGGADLSAIGKPLAATPKTAERLPAEIYAKLPGVIKEIVEHNLATALYPQPEIALAGAIALVSTLIGRKVTDGYGTRSNLYVVALAESGSGKDHSRDLNRKILAKANCSILEGPEELASGAGIVASLAEHPARLLQVDEVGDVFGVIRAAGAKSAWLANIMRLLKTLYSSSKGNFKAGGYKSVDQNKMIDQPSLTLYGSATEDFWESVSPKVVKDGTLGRIIVFGPVPAMQYKGRPPARALPQSILDYAKAWSGFTPGGMLAVEHPEPIMAQHGAESLALAESHITEISKRALKEEGPRRAIWMRTGEKTNKLALIFACSRVGPTGKDGTVWIDAEDVRLAIQIANWTTRQCVSEVFDKVYENDREKAAKKILKMLDTPQTKTSIIKATQGLRAGFRDELMHELISVGLINFETVPSGGGRPKQVYVRTGESKN